MNEVQRKLLIAVGAVVLCMLLYPPYRVYGSGSYSSSIRYVGYDWIFDLPSRATVDIATLVIQWLGVLIVGGIAYFILKTK
jgi:hypothetical protein